MLGSEKKLFDRRFHVTSRFSNISGLRVGAPVQLAGINVGTVSAIEFDQALDKKDVKLVLSISKTYQDRLREDSEATIVTQGLLGDKMLLISVGSPGNKILEEGDEVKAVSPVDFASMIKNGDSLIQSLNKVSENVEAISARIKEGEGLLHEIIYSDEGKQMMTHASSFTRNLDEMSAKINRGEGTLGALMTDSSVFNDLKTLLGKANRNKLIRSVIRYTLQTKDEKLLENSKGE